MSIRVVTHCWAVRNPVYAKLLRFQLASLINQPVVVSVYYEAADDATWHVLRDFIYLESPRLEVHTLPTAELGRRAIGRNHAALTATEDVVFFTDADHVFMTGAFDQLAEYLQNSIMVYPQHIMISKDHGTGQQSTRQAEVCRLPKIDCTQFVAKRYRRAIGGVQIVSGQFARQHGYLRDFPKWQLPAAKPFGDFRDDVQYRKFCQSQGPVRGVHIPGVFRIRHYGEVQV